MPLFIRDDVDAMAAELQMLLKTPTKTEALRLALHNELQRVRSSMPMRDRLAKARSTADAIGPSDPKFDQKVFSDALWDEL